jgi:hypothetical protein
VIKVVDLGRPTILFAEGGVNCWRHDGLDETSLRADLGRARYDNFRRRRRVRQRVTHIIEQATTDTAERLGATKDAKLRKGDKQSF